MQLVNAGIAQWADVTKGGIWMGWNDAKAECDFNFHGPETWGGQGVRSGGWRKTRTRVTRRSIGGRVARASVLRSLTLCGLGVGDLARVVLCAAGSALVCSFLW